MLDKKSNKLRNMLVKNIKMLNNIFMKKTNKLLKNTDKLNERQNKLNKILKIKLKKNMNRLKIMQNKKQIR